MAQKVYDNVSLEKESLENFNRLLKEENNLSKSQFLNMLLANWEGIKNAKNIRLNKD